MKLYRMVVVLSDLVALGTSNDALATQFANAGFKDIKIDGLATVRTVTAEWGKDVAPVLPSFIVDTKISAVAAREVLDAAPDATVGQQAGDVVDAVVEGVENAAGHVADFFKP